MSAFGNIPTLLLGVSNGKGGTVKRLHARRSFTPKVTRITQSGRRWKRSPIPNNPAQAPRPIAY